MSSSDNNVLKNYTKGKSIIRGDFLVSNNDQASCSTTTSQSNNETFIPENPKEIIPVPSPCISYFSGFQNPNNQYAYVYCYDWDTCLFSSGIDESPVGGPPWLVDGHFALKAIGPNQGIVIDSTGGYAGSYPLGSVHVLSDIINLGNYPVVVSDSYAHGYGNSGCGNPDGSWIRAELYGLGGNCFECDCGSNYPTMPTCTNSRQTLTYGYVDTLYKSSEIKTSCTDGSYRTCFSPCQQYGYHWVENRNSTVFNTQITEQIFINPLGVRAKVLITGTVDDELVLNGTRDNIPNSHAFSYTLSVPANGTTVIGYIDHNCCSNGIDVTLTYTSS